MKTHTGGHHHHQQQQHQQLALPAQATQVAM
jgi:hypothetical protein